MNLTKMTYPVFLLLVGIGLAVNGYSQSFLTNGLTAYYPFNGNANDASGSENNGTVNGATLTADRFGLTNGAYRFNGSSWIQLPDAILPVAAAEFTLSTWVLADAGPYTSSVETLVHLTTRTGEGGTAVVPNAQFGLGVNLQDTENFSVLTPMTTNRWTHVVGTFKQGQSVQLWVNGLLMQSNAVPNVALETASGYPLNSAIGIYDYTPGPFQGFNGAIDDVRIYNRALSASEVQQLYAYESAPPLGFLTNGLVAYYPFNGNANDASGFGNNGTNHSAISTTDRFGTPNSAYYFNGTNAYIDFGSPTLLAFQSNFTVTAWCWFSGGSPNSRILNYGGDNGYELLTLGTAATRQFWFSRGYGGVVQTTAYFPQNQWMQVVGVVSNGVGFFYVSGILSVSGPVSQASYSSGLQVGEWANHGCFWGGSIDDIRIYNRALSANEVAQLYAYDTDVPVIAGQPQNQTGTAGGTATFSVTATNDHSLTYQWLKDGVALPGATSTTLILTNIQPNQIGYYSVAVNNGAASVVSASAALTISGYDFAQWFGLVAYYPFNGNANDASGFGNNGTNHGAITTTNRFGTPNSAYYFNGTNAYIDFGSPALLAFQSNFTVTAWCWFNGGSLNSRILNYGGDNGYELVTLGTAATRQFWFSCGYGGVVQTTAYFPQNQWMQVVGVVSNGVGSFYVNGILSVSGPVSQASYSSGLQVGEWANHGCFWGGSIDDIRIYNRDLSPTEVQQLYAYESVPSPSFLTNGLVLYYPFNGNANDASGNGHNGTVDGATLTVDRFGAANSAYSFNGVSSDILLPETLFGPTIPACTVSVWLTTDGGPYSAQQMVLQKSTDNGPVAIALLNNTIYFGIETASRGFYNAGAPLLTNSTMHLVGVYQKGQSVALYTNGVLASTTAIPNENLWADAYPLSSALGSYHLNGGPYLWFRGVLDDFRVYTRALSASEVQQLHAYESVNPCLPHPAAATVELVNGFVVGATITDGGCGYTNTPRVLIQGGGGTGATATAVVSNGVVVNIVITDAGSGYTSAPTISIGSPSVVQVALTKAVRPSFSNLQVGLQYQLQVSGDLLNWTNQGSAFTATNAILSYPQYWDVDNWSQLYFRLQEAP